MYTYALLYFIIIILNYISVVSCILFSNTNSTSSVTSSTNVTSFLPQTRNLHLQLDHKKCFHIVCCNKTTNGIIRKNSSIKVNLSDDLLSCRPILPLTVSCMLNCIRGGLRNPTKSRCAIYKIFLVYIKSYQVATM